MATEVDAEARATPTKPTGALKPPTGALVNVVMPPRQTYFTRSLMMRIAEVAVFLVAVIGAIALGLGITDYLGEHRYVFAYLLVYAGFRLSDLLVREDPEDGSAREELGRRITVQLPLLIMFAAAPFERTYMLGGSSPNWLAALGLLLEVLGMWMTLGARIQLAYFAAGGAAEQPILVQSGFYRYIRHPAYAGTFLVTLGWPLEYGAPVTAVLTLIVGALFTRLKMKSEEAALLARFGEQYERYVQETDALIPSIW